MIVTCQACTKRYALDARAVGDEGRVVRCSNCGNTWHQKPLDNKLVDLYPEPQNYGQPKNQNRPQPLASMRKKSYIGWILFFLTVTTFFGSTILGREYIASKWPQTVTVYKKFGLSVTTAGVGLSLDDVNIVPILEGNHKGLIVKGSVTNISEDVRYLPVLRVKAFSNCEKVSVWKKIMNFFTGAEHSNSNLCMVDSWVHKFPETRLFPGEKAKFETTPHFTGTLVTDLTVSF